MGFRYTSPPWTQHIAGLGILATMSVAVETPWLQERWPVWLAATPTWFHFMGAVFVLHALVFWGMAAFFSWADTRGEDAWISKYRIQDDHRRRPAPDKVRKNLLVNQLILSPIMLTLIAAGLELRGWERALVLPSAAELWGMMAALTVCSVTYFYFSHRFLHRSWWMKRVHRVHHEYRSTTAVAAEYAHWFEFIFGNFGTMAAGVLLLAPSLFTIYVYSFLGTYTFVAHHSGYALPWITSPLHHDWHHFRYREAFGTYGFIDRWLGTDREFAALRDGQDVKR